MIANIPKQVSEERHSGLRRGMALPTISAFTLVELLVVLAIVAVWASLLVPALAKTKPQGETFQCMDNLRQMQRAHAQCAADHNGLLAGNSGGFASHGTNEWVEGWLTWGTSQANTNLAYLLNWALGPYVNRMSSVYKCPADKIPSTNGPRVRSISMNGFVGGTTERTFYGITGYRCFLKDTDFTRPGPAMTWVFTDEHPDGINDGLLGMHMPPSSVWTNSSVTWDDVPASYHNGAACLSFADGHVEIHKWLDPQTKPLIRKSGVAMSPGAGTGTTSPRDSKWLVRRSSAPL
jgi:prepilin-type N-terminal cleavage/methylation domain-containing protein/prepilin-type processing-associated H-X9-DG protein